MKNLTNLYNYLPKFNKIILIIITSLILSNCGIYKKVDTRQTPINAQERARQAVTEGKGLGIGNILKRGTNYEFSTSNPLWRASLETLDFLPLSNVDYSGGVIISDWYSDQNSKESIKISLQFLSNEIRADSIKILVFKKKCKSNIECSTFRSDSVIEEELRRQILKTAAVIDKESKTKK